MPKISTQLQDSFAKSISKIKSRISPKNISKTQKTIGEKIKSTWTITKSKLSTRIKSKPSKPKNNKFDLQKTINNLDKVRTIINNPIIKSIGRNILEFNNNHTVSLYTQNTCWNRRKFGTEKISHKIKTLDADIVCLQECFFESQVKEFENIHGYTASFVEIKTNLLSDTLLKMAKEKTHQLLHGGLIVLSKAKPISVDFVAFNNQLELLPHPLIYGGDLVTKKGFLVVEFEHYTVINTHLVSDQTKKWTEDKMKLIDLQALQIVNYIKQLDKSQKIIISGDFNFMPNNKSYDRFRLQKVKDITIDIPYTYVDKKVKLDYIFTNLPYLSFRSKIIKFYKSTKDKKLPSDHNGIYTKIYF